MWLNAHNIVFTFLLIFFLIFKLHFSSFRYIPSTVLLSPLFISITFHVVCLGGKSSDRFCKESCDKPRQNIKKQRHHFANKGLYSQSCCSPVVRYWCESWTIKKAEHRRIDAFELWYWRRLLKVPWTARRSNQSILKEINIPMEYWFHYSNE